MFYSNSRINLIFKSFNPSPINHLNEFRKLAPPNVEIQSLPAHGIGGSVHKMTLRNPAEIEEFLGGLLMRTLEVIDETGELSDSQYDFITLIEGTSFSLFQPQGVRTVTKKEEFIVAIYELVGTALTYRISEGENDKKRAVIHSFYKTLNLGLGLGLSLLWLDEKFKETDDILITLGYFIEFLLSSIEVEEKEED